MKTANEFKQELIDYVERSTDKPFPKEPLFVACADDITAMATKTTFDGLALEQAKPNEYVQWLAENWIGAVKSQLNMSLELASNKTMNYRNISLRAIQPKAKELLSLIHEIEAQCL